MKTISKILAIAFVFAFSSKSQAQSSATAGAFATIVTPIAITKTADMNFGNVAVQSLSSGLGNTGVGGTVVLSTSGTRSRTDGVTLPATAGTVSAASFSVTGEDTRTFAITLPTSNVTLTHSGGAGTGTMIVNAFNSDPSGTSTLSTTASVINVGATLNVSVGQAPGTYSGSFVVMVNYN